MSETRVQNKEHRAQIMSTNQEHRTEAQIMTTKGHRTRSNLDHERKTRAKNKMGASSSAALPCTYHAHKTEHRT
jgi:hypothetical protein